MRGSKNIPLCKTSRQSCPIVLGTKVKNLGWKWEMGFSSIEKVTEVQGVN